MDKSWNYEMSVEYTDTFGGVANYSWVKRAIIKLNYGMSKKMISQRCKRAVRLTGVKGHMVQSGDCFKFTPYHSCTVMFARVIY